MTFAAMMALALLIDAAIGWPDRLFRAIGHPVTWIGAVIAACDHRWNEPGTARRVRGVAVLALVAGLAGGVSLGVQLVLPGGWVGIVLGGILAWPLVAARSMYDHVAAVARPLQTRDLAAARLAVSRIVGRDPTQLDTAGVSRAALESLGENTSDGIVAPLFWGVVAGLPGIALYKAINTLDSMIGHKTLRHADFGWASARTDDLVNLVPARLTGLIFALVSRRPLRALRVMIRDAGHHRSPNAGWPEAALAGALHVRLSGPRRYGSTISDEPFINQDAPDPTAGDLTRGLALYVRVVAAHFALIVALAVL